MTDKQRQETYAQMLVRLSRSNFRSRFHLKAQDKQYIREKGWDIRCSSRSTRPPAAAAAVWQNGMASRRACRFRRSSRSISLEC